MKSTKYKMLVLDLDGTLTNAKKEITPRTKAALMQAQERGVRVVLASGRPTYGIVPLAEELELARYEGFILAFNGAKIIEYSTQEVVFEQTLSPEIVPHLYEAAHQTGMTILTYQGEGIAATNKEDEYVAIEAFINKMPVVQYDDFPHQIVYPINKCLIVGEPQKLHTLELSIAKEMNGRISVYRSADYFLECVPLNVDKAASLERLINRIDIEREEIIACGDGHNDLSMIAYAGLGVAMENATDQLKAHAGFITLSNEEDGIAHVIEKFLI
ncbi:MAG: Cof-type HAD-IIB family hydrolase [Prevotella sp.]|nr:Cof-type HAD-IIB family hydrolase [Prevotella sp.]MDY4217701.1 Cof-type HAD-IIB family hydrolase [Prevotella sp.]